VCKQRPLLPPVSPIPSSKTADTAAWATASTDELWSFLGRLEEGLRNIDSEPEVVEWCLTQFLDRMPAEGVAIQRCLLGADRVAPARSSGSSSVGAWSGWHARGRCPLSPALAENLVEVLQVEALPKPVVVNRMVSQSRSWPYPEVRQAIVRAIRRGPAVWGYLSIYNHFEDAEFDGVAADWVEAVAQTLEGHLSRVAEAERTEKLVWDLVEVFLRLLELSDGATHGHSLRVARLARQLASRLGCSADEQQQIYLGGLLHDLGKLGLERSLLEKSEALSAQELEQLRQHPEMGYQMLRNIMPLQAILPMVLQHHEQPDGGGYPLGLQLGQISLGAKIIAVADSYDALTQDRPYRPGCPPDQALLTLAAGSGQQWDRDVVAALLAIASDRLD
jgi:putative nucleotidyltransferase with HDIG domain